MLNRVTTVIIGLEIIVLLLWFPHVRWTSWKAVGGAIVVASLALVMFARVQLGRSFSVRAKARALVTTGIYSRVRNPIYLASGILFVGLALLFASPWPLLVAAVLVPLQTRRAQREAAVLRERFGEEYMQYRRRTWF